MRQHINIWLTTDLLGFPKNHRILWKSSSESIFHQSICHINRSSMSNMFVVLPVANHLFNIWRFTKATWKEREPLHVQNVLKNVVYILYWLPTSTRRTYISFTYMRNSKEHHRTSQFLHQSISKWQVSIYYPETAMEIYWIRPMNTTF